MAIARIAVVGSGAIGSYYGGKLAAAGRAVHFLVRSGFDELQEKGLRLTGPGEDLLVPQPNVYRTTAEIGPCDLVLIALKSTSNSVLPELIPPLLHDTTMLMTLQNGLGNEELLAERFGAERLLAGLCFICLSRRSPALVERFDHGRILVGEFRRAPLPRTKEIVADFRQCGIQADLAPDLALERWRKLVWNIPFNALTILAGCIDTEKILANEPLRAVTLAAMNEVIVAANACGYALEAGASAEQMARTETMGRYKPSTQLDFENGRPLEIEAIWGEPLRRALAAGAKVPRMELLYAVMKSLDAAQQAKGKPGQ